MKSHPRVFARASPSEVCTSRSALMSNLFPTKIKGMLSVSFTLEIWSRNWILAKTEKKTRQGKKCRRGKEKKKERKKEKKRKRLIQEKIETRAEEQRSGNYPVDPLKGRLCDNAVHQNKSLSITDPLITQGSVLLLSSCIKDLHTRAGSEKKERKRKKGKKEKRERQNKKEGQTSRTQGSSSMTTCLRYESSMVGS